MPHLFSPLSLRSVTLPNRIGVSPMCQYSCEDGFANDWHFAHLSARAVGGAALVFTEAAAVTPEGRISPQDLGVWSQKHFEPLERIARFIDAQGAVAGVQLAHAGRKASTYRPWSGAGSLKAIDGAWPTYGPSAVAFADNFATPEALTADGILKITQAFALAAARAVAAGFRAIEIHSAHGYLMHEFLSPFSNRRVDRYGGPLENRARLLAECVEAVRGAIPDRIPVFVRLSCSEWTPGGFDIDEVVTLARRLKTLGVDVVDCSSGGNVATAVVPAGPGYQVKFAERVRRDADILTAAVGMITSPAQADQIVRNGEADIALLARAMLRDPYWALRAAAELGHAISWPAQYLRAGPHGAPQRQPAERA